MSGGSFPPSGASYAGSQQPYFHQNGVNDLHGGQDYGKQSGMLKQGQHGGDIYGQRPDSYNEKPQHASSGRENALVLKLCHFVPWILLL